MSKEVSMNIMIIKNFLNDKGPNEYKVLFIVCDYKWMTESIKGSWYPYYLDILLVVKI